MENTTAALALKVFALALTLPTAAVIGVLAQSFVRRDPFLRNQVLIAVDQLGNAMLRGWSDETISSSAWRRRGKSRVWRGAQVAIDWVFEKLFDDPAHCASAYASERRRLHLQPEMRDGVLA